MNTEKKIKLLQLRKYNTSPGFLSHYEGPILAKGMIGAKSLSEKVKSKFEEDAKKFNWAPPPRARIAISFKIFCNQQNPPEIYKIVKCYLDFLKGSVFKDDKQVHYLEASIWRSNNQGSESSIFIKAERLINIVKIWDIHQEMDENIDDFDEKVPFLYPHLISKDLWDVAEAQYKLLKHSRVSKYDRPGLKKHIMPTMMSRLCSIDPVIFDIGHLPSKGESEIFQENINNHISNFGSKYSLFNKIYIPIELDIQITKASKKHFTDLDNVATKICKEFRKTILSEKVYINGYRIYVVDEIAKGIKADVRLKLLPAGEIESHNEKSKKALSAIEDKLYDDL